MADPVAHALYDGDGKMINVILWDGEAELGLPKGHKAVPYEPKKHAAEWAAANAPASEDAAPKARKSRLLGK